MFKKLILGTALFALVGGLVLGTGSYSYLKMAAHSLRDSVKDQIPIEVEIKRAREMISDLKPEIANNLKQIAREEVEVSKLQREVSVKQTALSKSKEAILKLKDDLQSGNRTVTYRGKQYTMEQVRQDLADRFKHHQAIEANSDKLAKILDARERNLVAARRKLDEMLAAKRELEVQIENLQARLTMVEVAQAGNKFNVSDNALGHVRQALDEISTRIDVAEKMANSLEDAGALPVESEFPTSDLIDEITNYFQDSFLGDREETSKIAGNR